MCVVSVILLEYELWTKAMLVMGAFVVITVAWIVWSKCNLQMNMQNENSNHAGKFIDINREFQLLRIH